MKRVTDLAGKRFGRWVVLSVGRIDRKPNGTLVFWRCRCDCGTEREIRTAQLRNGRSTSCGCLRAEALSNGLHRTHGLSKTRAYQVYHHMLRRCNDPADSAYKDYGARGIAVCERWQSFENFVADMGQPPSKRHSIDRRDNNAGYSPENCYWATSKQQNNNRRSSRVLCADGRSLTLAQWSDLTGVHVNTIDNRLKRGWALKRALGL